jgi:hypothetical protein
VLQRRVRQVRFVLGVGLAIRHLDIDVARWNNAFLQGKPYGLAGFNQLANAAQSTSLSCVRLKIGKDLIEVGQLTRLVLRTHTPGGRRRFLRSPVNGTFF